MSTMENDQATDPAPRAPADPAPEPHAPRLRTAIGAIAVYFLIQLGVTFVVMILMMIGYAVLTGAHDPKQLLAMPHFKPLLVIGLLPLSCGLSYLVFRRWFRSIWNVGGKIGVGMLPLPASRFGLYLLLGVGVSIAGGLLTKLLLLLTHGQPVSQDISQILRHTSFPLQLAIAVFTVTIVPLVEEVLFRGILLPALLRHMSVALAIIVDAALFGLVHLPDLAWKPQGLIALALVGAVCCWVRLKSGSLRASIAVHAGNNLLAMVALVAMH